MTTLDLRGLEAAARVKCRLDEEQMLLPDWDDLDGDQQDALRGEAEQIITAYLAVAQPIVETVEELEELPAETVIQTVDEGETEVWTTDGSGDDEWSLAGSCQRFSARHIPLPVRVIHRSKEQP